MVFQVSPGVSVSEIDLTTAVPAVSVSTGAVAGLFQWGPVLKVISVTSEVDLTSRYGEPDVNTAASFFTAANFLSYSNDLRVARSSGTSQKNATANATGTVINNGDDYFNGPYATYVVGNPWTARYPGALGNSLKVYVWANTAVWSANAANTADPLYTFANYFDFAPNTSPYVTRVSNGAATGDELHVLVVDEDGLFTGQANTVVEKYQSLSRIKDAITPDGSTNFYHEVLWKKSQYVYSTGIPAANANGWNVTIGSFVASNNDASANVFALAGGADGSVTSANVITALGLFANVEQQDISLLMTGDGSNTVINYAIGSVAEVRKDCIVLASPPLANVQDASGPATSIVNWAAGITRSSYAVVDSGFKYQYDKYNDIYRWIPLNGDIGGLCAHTDDIRDPWWSPAGLQRGVIKNVVKLAYNPPKADRDTLYKSGVNPVVSFPGEGTVLYGDKTFLNYASAFDHINVRRLFIVLEKSISRAARSSLFEFNDATTRAAFVSLVEPFLRTVKGRRGITDYKVVCDTTNNTGQVIDANQFVGDIYIKPARSINYIQLNFVAVRTGVSFNEVVGQF
jgi:phage tail sheath protein FI